MNTDQAERPHKPSVFYPSLSVAGFTWPRSPSHFSSARS